MQRVEVAVGVVLDKGRRILITRRAAASHQGGLWEFPGGKVEPGETVQQALTRELKEELGILVQDCQPLLEVSHDYSDKQVRLDIHVVTSFTGTATGLEGQPLEWVSAADLNNYNFPAANEPIVIAIQQFLTKD